MRRTAEECLDDVVVFDRSSEWRERAECIHWASVVDFFPARGESTSEAKAVCARCEVRDECLQFALDANIVCGIWGGLSERERRIARRERRRARAY